MCCVPPFPEEILTTSPVASFLVVCVANKCVALVQALEQEEEKETNEEEEDEEGYIEGDEEEDDEEDEDEVSPGILIC